MPGNEATRLSRAAVTAQPESAIEGVEARDCEVRVIPDILEPGGVPYRRLPFRLDETNDALDLRRNRCRVRQSPIEPIKKASGDRFCGRPWHNCVEPGICHVGNCLLQAFMLVRHYPRAFPAFCTEARGADKLFVAELSMRSDLDGGFIARRSQSGNPQTHLEAGKPDRWRRGESMPGAGLRPRRPSCRVGPIGARWRTAARDRARAADRSAGRRAGGRRGRR